MLLSASVNSISSMPSPVYECERAFLKNIVVMKSSTLRHQLWFCHKENAVHGLHRDVVLHPLFVRLVYVGVAEEVTPGPIDMGLQLFSILVVLVDHDEIAVPRCISDCVGPCVHEDLFHDIKCSPPDRDLHSIKLSQLFTMAVACSIGSSVVPSGSEVQYPCTWKIQAKNRRNGKQKKKRLRKTRQKQFWEWTSQTHLVEKVFAFALSIQTCFFTLLCRSFLDALMPSSVVHHGTREMFDENTHDRLLKMIPSKLRGETEMKR